ncbi:Na/Pi-cotransporter II-related protein [Budvicia aquatica]|uniref:Na/Pi-cotransporter II-related protein n=1 Tax=Budvicia aquatica TaxID=82979 RepID=A0A484ZVM0_9GAMM|nr:Na/Pi-cotransporter II-related protein [Budvicia aquatica]
MLTLLHLLSSVALLVWGTHIVRTGIMRVYGSDLRRVLSASMQKKGQAFIAGIGVTALVQSSNATALLVISFVSQGLISLSPGLVMLLGADVGTALMARVLTFDLSWLSPVLILFGVITFLSQRKSRIGQMGRVGIGLGLIILALQLIVASARTDNSGFSGTGSILIAGGRCDIGITDWCAVCDDQLFQPGCGSINGYISGDRLGATVYCTVYCYWF